MNEKDGGPAFPYIVDPRGERKKGMTLRDHCEKFKKRAEEAEAKRDSLLAQVKVKDEALRQCQDEMAAKGMNTAACDVGLAALTPDPDKPAPKPTQEVKP